MIDELTCVLTTDRQFRHLLRPEGTLRTAHLFPCSIRIRHQGQRIGVEFPGSDQFYWSLDPSGNTRMTQDECDSTGLPRLTFHFLPVANFWHEYHYGAIRDFLEAKGFDPYRDDVSRLLGLPLAEIESEIN